MQHALALRGSIQHYEWGSRIALAELLGRPAPSERAEAELWLGAHPRAPAEVRVAGRWERLDRLVERAADAVLGAQCRARFGARLPFLLKLLAVERPLSLQVHPDATRARAGFDRERAAGAGAPGLYADPHGKPELVCALTPFSALCGFQPLDRVRAHFAALGAEHLLPPGDDAPRVLGGFLRAWLERPAAQRERELGRLLEAAATAAAEPPVSDLLRLHREYPHDPGIVAPLLLHRVELAPGEALFLPPGQLHCHLAGIAVELMGSSDNVVRAGLTRKRVDVAELLEIASFEPDRPIVRRARPRSPGERVWHAPAEEFELALLEPTASAPVEVAHRRGPEVLWCAEGEVRIRSSADPTPLALGRGESCLVPAGAGPYRVAGSGRLFRAGLPLGTAGAPEAGGAGASRREAIAGAAKGDPCGS